MYENESLSIQQKRSITKSKRNHSNEKAAAYYLKNKETIKEKSKNQYKNLTEKEKAKIKKC